MERKNQTIIVLVREIFSQIIGLKIHLKSIYIKGLQGIIVVYFHSSRLTS